MCRVIFIVPNIYITLINKMKKRYIIELEEKENEISLKRTNDGFKAYELIGLLEMAKTDIINTIKDSIEPNIDIIKRQVVEESLNEK